MQRAGTTSDAEVTLAEAARQLETQPPAFPQPDTSHLVTEDDTPVDSIFSEHEMHLLTDSLYASWREDQGRPKELLALSNVGLFFALKNPAFVPDVMLSLDALPLPGNPENKENRSYFVWEYGKPPDLVIEIVSNREGGEDTHKLVEYARGGVAYYVIHDPWTLLSPRPLRAFVRNGLAYAELLDPTWLPGLNIGFSLRQETYRGVDATWLRWRTANGELLETGEERATREKTRADQEAARADEQSARAEEQAARAEEQATRADRLAEENRALREKLRQLGLLPE